MKASAGAGAFGYLIGNIRMIRLDKRVLFVIDINDFKDVDHYM